MQKISLFDIGMEFRALYELSNEDEVNMETGEVTNNSELILKLFNEVQDTLGNKLDNTMFVIRNLEFANSSTQGEIDYLDKLIKEKKQKVKHKENKIIFLKELMSNALKASGEEKLETTKFKFNRFVKLNTSVSIADEDELPREWLRIKREPKKKEIKEALISGIKIAGCSLNDSVVFTAKG